MDQGIAAFLTGVAGLIGAGIGGLATAYGARIGAQKSIEAVQVQVERQASSEHEHWVRGQRTQICNEIAAAWNPLLQAAMHCTSYIATGRPFTDAERSEVTTTYQTLSAACHQVILWGPNDLAEAANELDDMALALHNLIYEWRHTLTEGDETEITAHRAAIEEATDALSLAFGRYAGTARRTLAGLH